MHRRGINAAATVAAAVFVVAGCDASPRQDPGHVETSQGACDRGLVSYHVGSYAVHLSGEQAGEPVDKQAMKAAISDAVAALANIPGNFTSPAIEVVAYDPRNAVLPPSEEIRDDAMVAVVEEMNERGVPPELFGWAENVITPQSVPGGVVPPDVSDARSYVFLDVSGWTCQSS